MFNLLGIRFSTQTLTTQQNVVTPFRGAKIAQTEEQQIESWQPKNAKTISSSTKRLLISSKTNNKIEQMEQTDVVNMANAERWARVGFDPDVFEKAYASVYLKDRYLKEDPSRINYFKTIKHITTNTFIDLNPKTLATHAAILTIAIALFFKKS